MLGLIAKLRGRSSKHRLRVGQSRIEGTGVFVCDRVDEGGEIGWIDLGPAQVQDRHSLLVGDHHREVRAPWRYLNHACTPSARLEIGRDAVRVVATRRLEPDSELTIDYYKLPERISSPFRCRCESCGRRRESAQIG